MPQDKEEKTVDIDTSGPEVDVALPEEERRISNNRRKQMQKLIIKTVISPMIHLRNLMSSWMFTERTRGLRKKLQKKGIVSQQTTVAQLKNILRGLRKE